MIEALLRVLPSCHIKVLVADREFIGQRWLHWLNSYDIAYVIRVRTNSKVDQVSLKSLLKQHGSFRPGKLYTVWAQTVYIAKKRLNKTLGKSDTLIVISNKYCAQEALGLYAQQWCIEVVFAHLKKRRFDFESTRVSHPQRIENLVAILALAFGFAHQWGIYHAQHKHIPIKKHGYAAHSSFHYGLDSLKQILRNINDMKAPFRLFIILISSLLIHSDKFSVTFVQ